MKAFLSSVASYSLWSLMTLASLYFGIHCLMMYSDSYHRASTTESLGEGFYDKWFKAYHESGLVKYALFLGHVVCGGVVFVLSPFQLLGVMRKMVGGKVHKLLGQITFVSAVVSVISSILLVLTSKMGILCQLATFVFAPYTLVCIYKSFESARRKDFAAHREWACRMWALCFGVFYMRILVTIAKNVLCAPDAWLVTATAHKLFAFEFIAGWVTSCLFVEWYLRLTRAPTPSKSL
ncbi:membrane protein [Naegleria gruberi]|uniref:Membrane protein n=1 Tax=Naegleria gruberi TaxID=5762 RepID=D2VUI1_NAEGR|nr:uncharacterized protein NAEGRDRAFT_81276 [Naegleria gruberi]EFC39516.1 membrane protein [Naegleria gruberi]|eukprot:XP_002672260.1 membrane protein [Naegleria gruberi strain NEG-M]